MKYATFTGRASRSEYWLWTLFTFVIYLVLGLVTFAVGMATSRDGGRTPGLLAMPLLILFTVFFLGILLPTLAVTVRRLHDGGYSGLVALLFLLPYLGGLIIMIFALLPSSPAGAKYDPIPATPTPNNTYPQQNPYTSQGSLTEVAGPMPGRQNAPGLGIDRAQRLEPFGDQVGHSVIVLHPAANDHA
jgi:uncharacterized membrane protein YhaH (DUF805 family)